MKERRGVLIMTYNAVRRDERTSVRGPNMLEEAARDTAAM